MITRGGVKGSNLSKVYKVIYVQIQRNEKSFLEQWLSIFWLKIS